MGESSDKRLRSLLKGCRKKSRKAQKELYMLYYNYAMSIAMRYSNNLMEAQEITNDTFIKVFSKLELYDETKSFKGWLRRILVNTSIDYYRKSLKFSQYKDIEEAQNMHGEEQAISKLSEMELMEAIQQLSPAYRTIFNLYVIEGYKHEEIALRLGINVGTSKSNLAKARAKLKELILHHSQAGNYLEI
ncbi:MAG: sigma-70 family RNA polymerase sigma factor [Bacteroidota bacterium]